MIPLAVDRIGLDVLQDVVHPAHVPLVGEPEAANPRRTADRRPRRRLFGDGDRAGRLGVRLRVELADEVDRLEVLAAAEAVRNPLAVVARVVEVEHRRDGVDAQAVGVVLLQPEERVGEQEAAHLGAPVVEDERAPVAVLALPRIGVLEERRAVELGEPERVLRKVARHPVEDDADVVLMARVDERLEVRRRTEAARRREEARDLIAPRRRVRVLHHRQELDVRVAHVLDVGNEPLGELAVGQVAIADGVAAVLAIRDARPRPEMHFVDRHRPLEPRPRVRAPIHPVRVAPLVRRAGRRSTPTAAAPRTRSRTDRP